MKNVTVFDHPLIQHKTSVLRMKETSNKEFRESVEEITMLMCYEALRDLPLADVEIETPLVKTTKKMLAGEKLAVVPILRAGLGMVSGFLNIGGQLLHLFIHPLELISGLCDQLILSSHRFYRIFNTLVGPFRIGIQFLDDRCNVIGSLLRLLGKLSDLLGNHGKAFSTLSACS